MCEDVILNVTVDFIRRSKTNLELALNVERAMPHVRQHLVRIALDAVVEKFRQPESEWTIEPLATQYVMEKGAGLVLRRNVWTKNQSAAAIWLWTRKSCWMDVSVGLYFAGQSSQKIQRIKQTVKPLLVSGFTFDVSDENEPGVYKYLDAELRDWSGERFLIRLLEDGPDRIATEISSELNSIDEFVQSSELISLF